MGKTNLDSLELSGDLKAKNITASGTLTYDDLAVTGGATVGGALEITQGLSAGGQISSSGDILAVGDIVANGELRAYDNVTFGEVASPVGVGINGGLTVTGNASAATLTTTGKVEVGGNLVVDGDPQFYGILANIYGIEEPAATDEATAIALVNDIATKYGLLINYLRDGTIGP